MTTLDDSFNYDAVTAEIKARTLYGGSNQMTLGYVAKMFAQLILWVAVLCVIVLGTLLIVNKGFANSSAMTFGLNTIFFVGLLYTIVDYLEDKRNGRFDKH